MVSPTLLPAILLRVLVLLRARALGLALGQGLW